MSIHLFPFSLSLTPLHRRCSGEGWRHPRDKTTVEEKVNCWFSFCSSSICRCICMRYTKGAFYAALCILEIILYKHENERRRQEKQIERRGRRQPLSVRREEKKKKKDPDCLYYHNSGEHIVALSRAHYHELHS